MKRRDRAVPCPGCRTEEVGAPLSLETLELLDGDIGRFFRGRIPRTMGVGFGGVPGATALRQ